MSELPTVTLLVPTCEEAGDIEQCLRAVAAQVYPRELLDVVVVDGASSDRTAEVAEAVLDQLGMTHTVLSNSRATTPSNLNVGLAAAGGEILCRVDARSLLPPDYVRRCVQVLRFRPEVAVVGGAQVAAARGDDPVSLGIARALNNRWGMGLARYRRGAPSGPADTVYLGAFRRAQVEAAGGWEERFLTNQDFELNRRMAGVGQVWFESELVVGYRPRSSLSALARQYFRFGAWKLEYWRSAGDPPRPRQLLAIALPLLTVAGACVLFRLPRAWRRAAMASAAAAVVGFETAGPTGPRAPLTGHLVSMLASVATAGGWTAGVWSSLPRRRARSTS